jgi:hypothetical protein
MDQKTQDNGEQGESAMIEAEVEIKKNREG